MKEMIRGKGEDVKADVLIPYCMPRDEIARSSILMVHVRPETNKINYESAIIQSVGPYVDVVYLASLSGTLVNHQAIVASHYFSKLQFAIEGKEKMARYPEMRTRFEQKFGEDFRVAKIIGAFDAILEYKIKSSAEALFETMVPEEDFLDMYGQTIKRIDGYYVLNYDLPAIITRHHKDSAMFVLALRMKRGQYGFHDLDHFIYERMRQNKDTLILDSERRKGLAWYDQVRRTYHISRSHIESMFDLTDYVFKDDRTRIGYCDTPLGQHLLREGILKPHQLEGRLSCLKENPLVYLNTPGGGMKLVNIALEGKTRRGQSLVEHDLECCGRIIAAINWECTMELEGRLNGGPEHCRRKMKSAVFNHCNRK